MAYVFIYSTPIFNSHRRRTNVATFRHLETALRAGRKMTERYNSSSFQMEWMVMRTTDDAILAQSK